MRLCCLLIILLAVATPATAQLANTATCGCYWDKDCNYCSGYGKCTTTGKLDGSCTSGTRPLPGAFALTALVEAVDLYFQAYLVPVRARQGRPDKDLFDKAGKVRLGRYSSPNHKIIQEVVHDSLDAVLGFDFQFPACGEITGNIRGVPPEAGDLVEAVRKGFIEGLKNDNPEAVAAPVKDFWEKHPNYRPLHTGRYYPHGHPEFEVSPPITQIDVLERRIARLRRGKKSPAAQ